MNERHVESVPDINETETTVMGNPVPDPIDEFLAGLNRRRGNQRVALQMKQDRRAGFNKRRDRHPEIPDERKRSPLHTLG